MSFTIATIDSDGKLMVAADTLISSQSGLARVEIESKIFEITPHFAILGAGTWRAVKDILSQYKNAFNPTWTFEQKIAALKIGLITYDKSFKETYGVPIDCTFILANQEQGTPYIATVIRTKGQTYSFQEPQKSGQYDYMFSYPTDLSFEWCDQLCRQSFQSSDRKPTKDILTEITVAVADHSRFVNQDIQLWSPH